MDSFEQAIFSIDNMLNTRRRRHLAGGILLSFSMLFTGLALTIITIKNEDVLEEEGLNE